MLEPAARSRRRPRARTVAVAVAVVLWLTAGVAGAVRYVEHYWLYRGFPPPMTPAGVPRGTLREVTFRSEALRQTRRYLVYLPPGYGAEAAAGRRFPVLYLLHAPPGRPDGFVQAGAITVQADVLLARRRIRPMILVIPYGKSGTFGNDTEWANARAGRYESFVIDAVRDVDHRFATYANRRHRGLAGLSEGGYGAINVGLHHLGAFSVLQSWSGYFAETPTASFKGVPRGLVLQNSPTAYLPSLAPRIRRIGLRVFLYQGISDEIRPWRIRAFAAELYRAGAYVSYGFYRGGHDWGLWRRQTPHMLRVASAWFATPPTAQRLRHAPRGHGRPRHPRAGHAHARSPRHRHQHTRRISARRAA